MTLESFFGSLTFQRKQKTLVLKSGKKIKKKAPTNQKTPHPDH
jgi:hypothetical protein